MGDQSLFVVFVTGGGFIGYLIWLISIVMVALVVKFAIAIRREVILPEQVQLEIAQLFEEKKFREAIDRTAEEPSFLSGIINAALSQASGGYSAMERAMEEAAEERTTRMFRNIEWLNLIGNVSPMLGLLGTVLGMLLMFMEFTGGTVDINKVSGKIGIALVTTLLGLSVAIPATSAYAILRERIETLTDEALAVSQELIVHFRSGK
ncbi:MAG: MotA/TolQ/ExbB proton channel family protein [Planctomycetes bacterium]|nr:MotA/TolQ/ExbB proton channel family protein [Planctomycetota bacterium]